MAPKQTITMDLWFIQAQVSSSNSHITQKQAVYDKKLERKINFVLFIDMFQVKKHTNRLQNTFKIISCRLPERHADRDLQNRSTFGMGYNFRTGDVQTMAFITPAPKLVEFSCALSKRNLDHLLSVIFSIQYQQSWDSQCLKMYKSN